MAINLPDTDLDFSKIFALNTPLNPYHWSDSNYQTGWNTVGQTPPTRGQFDALQNFTDKKLNFLRQCVTAFKEGIDGEGGIVEKIEKTENDIKDIKNNLQGLTSQVEKQEVQVNIDPELVQYYVKLGNSFVMQYGEGVTDANGVAKCNFTLDFKETTKADYPTLPEGIGIYIPVPAVWVNDNHSYCVGVGAIEYEGTILRRKNFVYLYVTSGQTGLPVPDVSVGVFAFGLAPEAKI